MFEKEWSKVANHGGRCPCTDCQAWYEIENRLTAQAEEAANAPTGLYCSSHTTTPIQAQGNSYYCPACNCAPEQVTCTLPALEISQDSAAL